MTLSASIKTGLSRLADFGARASREEYVGYSAFLVLAMAVLLSGLVLASAANGGPLSWGVWLSVLMLGQLLWAAAQTRRLRDAGLRPGWAWANLLPFVGSLLGLLLSVPPGIDAAEGHEGVDTHHGSLSIFSPPLATGWGGATAAGALNGDTTHGRDGRFLLAAALAALAIVGLSLLARPYLVTRPQAVPAVAPALTPATPRASSLVLIDDASGARLYYDKATATLVAPDTVSVQLVFDFDQAVERDGVTFRSMKQNEIFQCMERGSSWSTRFYMSEPMGEGAAVFIEEGKGSLLDMSDGDVGLQRLEVVCGLLRGLQTGDPASKTGA